MHPYSQTLRRSKQIKVLRDESTSRTMRCEQEKRTEIRRRHKTLNWIDWILTWFILSQWRDLRKEVIRWNLGVRVTALQQNWEQVYITTLHWFIYCIYELKKDPTFSPYPENKQFSWLLSLRLNNVTNHSWIFSHLNESCTTCLEHIYWFLKMNLLKSHRTQFNCQYVDESCFSCSHSFPLSSFVSP